MKRLASLLLALAVSAQAAFAQQLVLPIGKNQANAQSPANPQCMEVDTGGLVSSATNPQPVQLSQANSAVAVTNPLNVLLSNGTASLSGQAPKGTVALPVQVGPSTLSTYMASTAFQTPVATATDIVGIIGSATKTVKILRIVLNATQTTAGINKFFLIKRSTANTGSTVVNPTIVPVDSGNSAGTTVVKQYTTTNPTTGSAVGTIASISALCPAPAATAVGGRTVLFDSTVMGQPIVLNGVAQELDLNFAGAAIPSGLDMSVTFVVTEE